MTATAVHLRPDLGRTLGDLREELSEATSGTQIQDVPLGGIDFRLDADTPSIIVGNTEVPAHETGIVAFGDFLGVPSPFLKRIYKNGDRDLVQNILQHLMLSAPQSAIAVRYGDGGVNGVFEAGKTPLDPTRLVTIAERVLGTESAPVQRLINDASEFSFDVHVPFDSSHGVGGDGEVEAPDALQGYSWASKTHYNKKTAKVRDVTAGGLRFGVDLKRGLTPWVQPWLMRLACTNGMEMTDAGLKVDGRGQTLDEVLAEIEAQAQRAFSRVEDQIAHFYRLREQRVDNPERTLIRLAAERGIPERSLRALTRLAPTDALPDNPTMFDLTNLVTNLSNHPDVRNDGGRLILERAGGGIVNDEAARCGHCHQKVSN